jgi:hypothetical protein
MDFLTLACWLSLAKPTRCFWKVDAVYKRFDAKSLQEKLMRLIHAFVIEPDLERLFIMAAL